MIYTVQLTEENELFITDELGKPQKKEPQSAPDLVVLTTGLPAKYVKTYLDQGGKVYRCTRESVEADTPAEIAANMLVHYAAHPQAFKLLKLDPPLSTYYQIYKSYQQERIRTNNRLYGDLSGGLNDFLKLQQEGEAKLKKIVEEELIKQPVYTQWLGNVKGIGPSLGAGIIALIGDVGKYDSISNLWAYSGYSVINGAAQKKTKGQLANWNGKIRTLMYLVVTQFIKANTVPYRGIYDDEKAKQITNGIKKGHAHARAMRKTAKIFLQHYWVEARKIAGLPISQPWIIAHGGHVHQIMPPQNPSRFVKVKVSRKKVAEEN